MLDYAIYRFGYSDAKWLYPKLILREGYIPTYVYIGFWNEMYVGYMACSFENIDTGNIQYSYLIPELRGVKTVRIVREILKTIHKDFKNIITRADTSKNDMIKLLLSAGFRIIGTKAEGDLMVVELLKTDE